MQRNFHDVMTRGAPLYAQSGKPLAEAKSALKRQIVAEPYDRQAVHSAFVARQQSWNRLFDNADDTLIEALAQVSPERRRKLIAQRQAEPKKRPCSEIQSDIATADREAHAERITERRGTERAPN
jgi:hypothetical protein